MALEFELITFDDRRRFEARFEHVWSSDFDFCWPWIGGTERYGRFTLHGRTYYAHRFSYEFYVGEIPEGLEVDHLCRNTRCVNPAHLEPVTHHENLMRGESPSARCARITECPRGHPYTTENTCLSKGHRYCRTCARERMQRRRAQER